MNEKYSVKPSAVQMVLPRIHLSPLGMGEDSPVIKGELHRCNISKSLLAKWRKKRRGSGERRPLRKEERGDLNPSGFKGLVVKTKTPFPSEPALIMRSCRGMEGYISAVNVFNMAVKTLSDLASPRHIISPLMPVISMFCFLL